MKKLFSPAAHCAYRIYRPRNASKSDTSICGLGSAPLNNCGCGCYNGVHVRMEAKAGSGVALYCNTDLDGCGYPWLYRGSTLVYRFAT